jgi:hypothetical protein
MHSKCTLFGHYSYCGKYTINDYLEIKETFLLQGVSQFGELSHVSLMNLVGINFH